MKKLIGEFFAHIKCKCNNIGLFNIFYVIVENTINRNYFLTLSFQINSNNLKQ